MTREVPPTERLPDVLEARLREVEAAATSNEFDRASWFWMILLGIVIPLGLIIYGGYWMASGR